MLNLRSVLDRIRPSRHQLYWLTDDIAISREPAPGDIAPMQRAGVRCVVDMRLEAEDRRELFDKQGLRYLRVPIAEGAAPTVDHLRLITDWIVERLQNEGPVLVHCREGRGRSALVACATLVKRGAPLFDAYQALRRARPETVLNDEQAEALKSFAIVHQMRSAQLSR
jgi:atypical dual specificity phosphatase